MLASTARSFTPHPEPPSDVFEDSCLYLAQFIRYAQNSIRREEIDSDTLVYGTFLVVLATLLGEERLEVIIGRSTQLVQVAQVAVAGKCILECVSIRRYIHVVLCMVIDAQALLLWKMWRGTGLPLDSGLEASDDILDLFDKSMQLLCPVSLMHTLQLGRPAHASQLYRQLSILLFSIQIQSGTFLYTIHRSRSCGRECAGRQKDFKPWPAPLYNTLQTTINILLSLPNVARLVNDNSWAPEGYIEIFCLPPPVPLVGEPFPVVHSTPEEDLSIIYSALLCCYLQALCHVVAAENVDEPTIIVGDDLISHGWGMYRLSARLLVDSVGLNRNFLERCLIMSRMILNSYANPQRKLGLKRHILILVNDGIESFLQYCVDHNLWHSTGNSGLLELMEFCRRAHGWPALKILKHMFETEDHVCSCVYLYDMAMFYVFSR